MLPCLNYSPSNVMVDLTVSSWDRFNFLFRFSPNLFKVIISQPISTKFFTNPPHPLPSDSDQVFVRVTCVQSKTSFFPDRFSPNSRPTQLFADFHQTWHEPYPSPTDFENVPFRFRCTVQVMSRAQLPYYSPAEFHQIRQQPYTFCQPILKMYPILVLVCPEHNFLIPCRNYNFLMPRPIITKLDTSATLRQMILYLCTWSRFR